MTRYFKAQFFGIVKPKSHQITAGGKVQFFKPKFEFVELTQWQEVPLLMLNQVKVGPYWEFKTTGWFGSGLDIFFKEGEKRFENQKLIKEVVLIPSFNDHNAALRHVHDFVDGIRINEEYTRIRGEAYFQITIPQNDAKAKVVLNPGNGTVDVGGTMHIVGGSGKFLDEGETNYEGFNKEVNKRVLPLWNRWLNWLLLATGLGLIPFAPWLGLAALAQPLRSWSRTTGTSQGSGISIIWLLLAALVVGFAFFIGSPYAWPLAVVFLLMMIVRKGAKQGWVVAAVVLFILLALLALLPMLTERLTPKEDEDSKKANVKSRREKKEGSGEIISRHSIEWPYPQRTNLNLMQYATADAEYSKSLDNHDKVSKVSATEEMQFWNQAYRILLAHDQEKVDSIANIVQSVSEKKNFSTLQSAEYLVTMIQEIPYVLVHDMTCKEAVLQYKGFVAQYHMQGKPCLPNIVAGVQSPYEFMHNLKGDCDTRTLFAHAVLNKLGISSSVWVSSAYGHSILGVGVPGSSNNRKIVNGVPHYAVELTAKNFRIGMIAPEQNQMSNWKIAVYKNF